MIFIFMFDFRNSHFGQSQDVEEMRTKGKFLTTSSPSPHETFIADNRLHPHDKNERNEKNTIARTQETNKENKCEHKLHNRDSGNVISIEDDIAHKSESENAKLSQTAKPVKHPLHRKSSNITNDSGRSTVSDIGENDGEFQADITEGEGSHYCPVSQLSSLEPLRRESLTVVDSTGHLTLPNPIDCLPGKHFTGESIYSEEDSDIGYTKHTAHSPYSSAENLSPNASRSSSRTSLAKRHAPKILYSASEDGALNQGRTFQRSPYSSPTASPRLRRQPTMETRRISVSDSSDGYTQLNQYKLKDEIGKVSIQNSLLISLN